jgi:hypothetical protein
MHRAQRKTHKQNQKQNGQALIEFALTLPILLIIIVGIMDISRIFFAYTQASNSLRSALRFAEVLGIPGDTPPYLDCSSMEDVAKDNWFASNQNITIRYLKSNSSQAYSCDSVQANLLDNGDILQIQLTAEVDPFFLPFGALEINFRGQRTIVKAITPGANDNDEDYDGLNDTWETTYFPSIEDYTATDDPDGDGCNNGCEESAGTDPTDPNSAPDWIIPDIDGDGIDNTDDNCSTTSNPNQTDTDGDGQGDACDLTPNGDNDDDGIDNLSDNCPNIANGDQRDQDTDGIGDVCDDDLDGDGLNNGSDNCPDDYNPYQTDEDSDGVGDVCDIPDTDGDGIDDVDDNCVLIPNSAQMDTDFDGYGDACDLDVDNDGLNNDIDNCPGTVNADQADMDTDGVGDVCDSDIDGDGVGNSSDNCPTDANTDQEDSDIDGQGDVCDPTPYITQISGFLASDGAGKCEFTVRYLNETVSLLDTSTSERFETKTNEVGFFQFTNLTIGHTYTLTVPSPLAIDNKLTAESHQFDLDTNTCTKSSASTFTWTLTAGQQVLVEVGYK